MTPPATVVPLAKSGPAAHTSQTLTAPPTPPPTSDPGTKPATMASSHDGLDQLAGTGAPTTRSASPATKQSAVRQQTPPAKPSSTPPPEAVDDPVDEPEVTGDLESRLSASEKPPAKAEPATEPTSETGDTSTPAQPLNGPKALRDAFASQKARAEKAEARIKELEESTRQHATLAEELETRKKTTDEMEQRIRVLDYKQSNEYRDKFSKPMDHAWKAAVADVSEMVVATDENGGTRPATAKDLEAIVTMPGAEARRVAKAMFGDAAEEVMAHRRKLVDLARDSEAAVGEWREKGGELSKRQQAEAIANRERTERLWTTTLEQKVKQYPQLFGQIEGDTEGNKLLDQGVQEADYAMSDLSNLPLEQRVEIHARIRNRAAAYPREVHRRQVADARIKELEAELEGFRASEPGKGQPPKGDETTATQNARSKGPATLESALAGLDRLSG